MQKLRVLYLKKAVGITRSSLWNSDHTLSAMSDELEGTPWVALGEYDLIVSYSSQYSSLFSYISEHNSDLASQREIGVYSRAMYLLPYTTDLEFETDFWKKPTEWFIGVIRLHLASCSKVHTQQSNVAEKIKNILSSHSIQYCMYQTVELGDIVLAMRSNSLKHILEIAAELNAVPDIAKSYTYCGMNLALLKHGNLVKPNNLLPYVSMSFSIRETSGVKNALQALSRSMGSCEKYAATGTDDCVVTWSNVSETKLIDTFTDWIDQKNGTNYKQYDLLNLHTTLGITTDLNAWKITPNCAHTPVALCQKLSASLDRFDRRKPDWYKYFNRLVSSLKYIANAPEFDEFVFLFYPSTYAILENLIRINARRKEDKKVFRYIQNWNYLMENIMQAEGHLTLMPEVHPQIFDIPPVFLEYIQAFLGQCVALLHEAEFQDNVEFLLTPTMCERIEAYELFNIFEYEIGVVLIDIPFSMFKDLKTIQIALCHEVSHYVGEKYRNREYRSQRFIEAAALLVSKNLFGSFNKGLINTLIDCYQSELEKALLKSHNDICSFRLKDIVSVIANWTYSLFTNASFYAQFLKKVFSNEEYTSQKGIIPITDNLHISTIVKHQIVPQLNDLYHLFRECFADVCAIYLLDLESNEYYYSIEKQISVLGEAQNDRLAIRLAVSLAACNRDLECINSNDKLFITVQKYYNQCIATPEIEPHDQVFPVSTVMNLYGYLKNCFALLKDIDTTNLQKFLVDDSDDADEDWESFYLLIDNYRSSFFS